MSILWSRADQHARNVRALSTDHLMADLGRRTAAGSLIAIVAQGFLMLLQVVQAGLLSRLLNPADFGLMAMAMSVTGLIGIFADPGLSASIVQRKVINQDFVSAIFFTNVLMGTIVMLACFAVAPLAGMFYRDERVTWLIVGLSLSVPLGSAGAQHLALLNRSMRWRTIQLNVIITQSVGMLVSVVLAWSTNLEYWSLVASGWVTSVIGLTLSWYTCSWRPTRVRDWSKVRLSFNFGAYLTGFHLVDYVKKQLDNVLIGWRWGAMELGFYSRAYTLFLMPMNLINGPVGTAIVPALSRLQHDSEQWRRTYLNALGIVTALGALIGAGLVATAVPLVQIVFGQGWETAAFILQCLAVALVALTPMSTISWIYVSLGQTDRLFIWSCWSVPLIVIAFAIGLPFGAIGVAISYSASMFTLMIPCLYYAVQRAPLMLSDVINAITPFLMSGALAGLVGITISGSFAEENVFIDLLATSFVTFAIYFISVFLLYFVSPQTRYICSFGLSFLSKIRIFKQKVKEVTIEERIDN